MGQSTHRLPGKTGVIGTFESAKHRKLGAAPGGVSVSSRFGSSDGPHGLEKPNQLFTRILNWRPCCSLESKEMPGRIADGAIRPVMPGNRNRAPDGGDLRAERGRVYSPCAANAVGQAHSPR